MSYLICQVLYLKSSILFLWQRDCKCYLLRKAISPTFYDSPCCLPPQNSFAIHLIFFVAAHHGKGHRLLWTETFQHGSVYQRERHKVLWDETNTQHAPVPWHSAWRKQCVSVGEIGSGWVERRGGKDSGRGGKSQDKCKWKKDLLWSCRCRSCPPCRHQTLSVGKTQSRPSPAPSLPTAQNKADEQTTHLCDTSSSESVNHPTLCRGFGIYSLSNTGILRQIQILIFES